MCHCHWISASVAPVRMSTQPFSADDCESGPLPLGRCGHADSWILASRPSWLRCKTPMHGMQLQAEGAPSLHNTIFGHAGPKIAVPRCVYCVRSSVCSVVSTWDEARRQLAAWNPEGSQHRHRTSARKTRGLARCLSGDPPLWGLRNAINSSLEGPSCAVYIVPNRSWRWYGGRYPGLSRSNSQRSAHATETAKN